jgi:hypothetical protein
MLTGNSKSSRTATLTWFVSRLFSIDKNCFGRIKRVDVTQLVCRADTDRFWLFGEEERKTSKDGDDVPPCGEHRRGFLFAPSSQNVLRGNLEQLRRFAAAVMVAAGVIMVI